MPRLVAHGSVAVALLLPSAVATAGPVERCDEDSHSRIVCVIADTTTTPGTPARHRGTPAGPRPAPSDVVYSPDVVVGADDAMCVRLRRRVAPGAALAPQAAQIEQRFMRLTALYPLCSGVALPATSPVFVARSFFSQVALPVPRPAIAPGFAITGMDAFLETGSSLHPPPFSATTALGPIELVATGTYRVDWGDGRAPGRFATEGGPWPHGPIAHTYTHMGTYDVVVVAEWTARWRVGTTSGTLTGVRTEGRIDDFEVRQVQAVRNL